MIRRRRRSGFTLVEVMVALVVGGMAVAGAGALLGALADRARAIERAAASADGDANAERELRSLLASLDVSADTTVPSFVGDADSATFRAWCETPAGWLDHCTAHLRFGQRDGAAVLSLELQGAYSSAIDLRRAFQRGRFGYLVEIDRHLTWVDRLSRLVPPTALAVIIDADTLLLPVGGGG
jgi:prepilin-type N-terminal cleavage/methylation domain-containing protein